jgi:hypothetical protein
MLPVLQVVATLKTCKTGNKSGLWVEYLWLGWSFVLLFFNKILRNKIGSFFFNNPVLYFSILLHCIVRWVLQAMFPSACSFIVLIFTVFHYCFGLHDHLQVCRIFIFICLKDSASLLFFWFAAFFSRGHTLHAESFKHMKINILHTWRWACRPKHVVKDSENQYNRAARRRKHNLQNPLSSINVNLECMHPVN